ncbi:MAG: hypothetical protein K2J95_13045 [Lachnospiraceae bacterium]|nr:hypothetical protein [Lachnospiraceae bacterium]
MALKDEIREQNKKWKTMTRTEKKKYFLTYYKWHVIIFCVILIAVVILVRDIIRNSRERLLYIMVLNNSEQYMYQGLMDEFAEYAGIDLKEYNLTWDTDNILIKDNADYATIATIQKFDLYATDGTIDAIILPESDLAYFEEEAYFIIDLQEFMEEGVYAAVEDRLYFFDCEAVSGEIAIGFYLEPDDRFYEIGLFEQGERAVMIPLSNSSHLEYLYRFLKFMNVIS